MEKLDHKVRAGLFLLREVKDSTFARRILSIDAEILPSSVCFMAEKAVLALLIKPPTIKYQLTPENERKTPKVLLRKSNLNSITAESANV